MPNLADKSWVPEPEVSECAICTRGAGAATEATAAPSKWRWPDLLHPKWTNHCSSQNWRWTRVEWSPRVIDNLDRDNFIIIVLCAYLSQTRMFITGHIIVPGELQPMCNNLLYLVFLIIRVSTKAAELDIINDDQNSHNCYDKQHKLQYWDKVKLMTVFGVHWMIRHWGLLVSRYGWLVINLVSFW